MGGQGNYLKKFLSHVLAASVTLWLIWERANRSRQVTSTRGSKRKKSSVFVTIGLKLGYICSRGFCGARDSRKESGKWKRKIKRQSATVVTFQHRELSGDRRRQTASNLWRSLKYVVPIMPDDDGRLACKMVINDRRYQTIIDNNRQPAAWLPGERGRGLFATKRANKNTHGAHNSLSLFLSFPHYANAVLTELKSELLAIRVDLFAYEKNSKRQEIWREISLKIKKEILKKNHKKIIN